MSVNGSCICYIQPFARLPDSPLKNPWGRFFGRVVVAGDASGGLYAIVFTISGASDLNPHLLFRPTSITWFANSPLVGAYSYCVIPGGERCNDGLQPLYEASLNGTTIAPLVSDTRLPELYFKVSSQFASNMQLGIAPNTNLVTIDAHAFGLLYDERYM